MDKKEIGNLGEKLAEKYLIQQKYVILDKNYHIKGGEADIIAQDPETKEIVFVEVKTRTSTDYGWPEQAINEKKRLRLAKTAHKYLAENNYDSSYNYRFDAVSVELDYNTRLAKVSHFKYI